MLANMCELLKCEWWSLKWYLCLVPWNRSRNTIEWSVSVKSIKDDNRIIWVRLEAYCCCFWFRDFSLLIKLRDERWDGIDACGLFFLHRCFTGFRTFIFPSRRDTQSSFFSSFLSKYCFIQIEFYPYSFSLIAYCK